MLVKGAPVISVTEADGKDTSVLPIANYTMPYNAIDR